MLKAGQLAVDDDFMLSAYTGLFVNSAFGAMPSQVGNRLGARYDFSPAFPMFSVAAPGIFVSSHPHESYSIQAAVYHGRPGLDTPENHGFGWTGEGLRCRPLPGRLA